MPICCKFWAKSIPKKHNNTKWAKFLLWWFVRFELWGFELVMPQGGAEFPGLVAGFVALGWYKDGFRLLPIIYTVNQLSVKIIG